MKKLSEVGLNEIITVRKIFGGRVEEKRLEDIGIMPGSDITVLAKSEDSIKVAYSCKMAELTISEAEMIGVSEHFVRKDDPILLGGCCGGGNAIDLMEKYFDKK